jgi:hypothetical protein
MTYENETWSLTMSLIRKLNVTQRVMERAILGVSPRDRTNDGEMIADIAQRIAQLKRQ